MCPWRMTDWREGSATGPEPNLSMSNQHPPQPPSAMVMDSHGIFKRTLDNAGLRAGSAGRMPLLVGARRCTPHSDVLP